MNLEAVLRARSLLICVGAGGVGKTSMAATLGLQAARLGRKVLVVTIDPAQRLANALGLPRFGNEPTQVALAGVEGATGELWAMMLDTQKTFDDLIERAAPDEPARRRILDNPVYRSISDSFSSSHDYMATEMLYEVVSSGLYDLVVLDTPPVKNALDFLDSPGRLARFLDKQILKWFLAPYDEGKVFSRLLSGTSHVVFRLLGHIFGREFLAELSEFFLAFRDLYDGFRMRHEAVVRLFGARGTAFVVVCAPTGSTVEVAGYFHDELRRRRLPVAGAILNQLHLLGGLAADPRDLVGPLLAELSSDLPPDTAERVLARVGAAHGRLRELADVEAGVAQSLRQRLGVGAPIWVVPRVSGALHDVVALDRVGRLLLQSSGKLPSEDA